MSLFNVNGRLCLLLVPHIAFSRWAVALHSRLPRVKVSMPAWCTPHCSFVFINARDSDLYGRQFLLQAILKSSLTEFTVPTTYSVPCAILEDGIAAFIGVFLP